MKERPLIVSVNLTTSCNLACTYCHAIQRREELSPRALEETLAGLEGLREPVRVLPFGGEPLLAWPAFQRLVTGAAARGVSGFFLCTNGLLMRRRHLDFLNDHGFEVTLSWDGVPAANDRLRVARGGRATSAQTERLFGLLAACRRRPHVRMTVAPETAAYLGDSARFVYDRLGATGVKIYFMPLAAAPWSPEALDALDAGILGAAAAYAEHRAAGQDVSLAYNECVGAHELGEQILFDDRPYAHACLWGVKALGVDADGGLYPCHTALELSAELRAGLRLGRVSDGMPALEARRAAWPELEGNPYHQCYSWNLVATGSPFKAPEVYRRAYRAVIRESVRLVRRLRPERGAQAAESGARLLRRAARWEKEQAALRLPAPGKAA